MLTDKSYLVVEHPDHGEGVFELRGAEENTELERQMLLGNRGSLIQNLSDITPGIGRLGKDGAAYNVDAGDGDDTMTLSFKIDAEETPVRWGNGSGGDSREDASGAHPVAKRDTFRYWLRTSRTDSGSPAKLHHGNWCTDRFADSAGFFREPMECIVLALSTDWERDEPSAVTGVITLQRTSSFPSFPSDDIDGLGDILDDLLGGGDDGGDGS